jgi:hypothetical protein
LESLTIVLYDEIKMPFRELQPFLNIHGHKLRSLTLRDANPLMRTTPLVISGILSRCPELKEIAIVGSCTAPLQLTRSHMNLERIRFLGIAPGSTKEMGMDVPPVAGSMPDLSHLGHLLALCVENVEGRSKFPKLREIMIRGEEGIEGQGLRLMWQTAVGPNVAVTCVGQDGITPLPLFNHVPNGVGDTLSALDGDISLITPTSRDPTPGQHFEDDDEDDEDGEWLPDEDDEPTTANGVGNLNGNEKGSDEEDEDAWLASVEDERSDDETVRDSRSGRGRDDDQIDHTTALLIFQEGLAEKKLRHSFVGFPSQPMLGGGIGNVGLGGGDRGERVGERNGVVRRELGGAGVVPMGGLNGTPMRSLSLSVGPGNATGHIRGHASERESAREHPHAYAPGQGHSRGLSGSFGPSAHSVYAGHGTAAGHGSHVVPNGHGVHGGHGPAASVSGS